MLCTVNFPPGWVDTIRLDEILLEGRNPHSVHYRSVMFVFADDCEIRIDAILRLLSLANQICCEGVRLTLVFEGKLDNLMNYLAGVSFFEFLDPAAEVLPFRPTGQRTAIVGKNSEVVEVLRVGETVVEQNEVPDLVDRFLENIEEMSSKKLLRSALFTILGELVSNIQRHSCLLNLDGYVALQRYIDDKQHFCIAASDSSIGLIETLNR